MKLCGLQEIGAMASMTDKCIFCDIVAGKLPAYKLYEDELFVAILDRFPVNPGHTLIIPKFHAEDIFGLCEKEALQIMPLAQKLVGRIKEVLNPNGFNILQNNGKAAGQVVFHYHMHIIPRFAGDGVKINPMSHGDVSEKELEEVAAKIKF